MMGYTHVGVIFGIVMMGSNSMLLIWNKFYACVCVVEAQCV